MSDHTSRQCNRCNRPIYWHRSKTGRNYPTDSPTDRRAFHECTGPAPAPLRPQTMAPARAPEPLEATMEERVAHLEQTVAKLVLRFSEAEKQRPIGWDDVGF
jgi:hypothetical protein